MKRKCSIIAVLLIAAWSIGVSAAETDITNISGVEFPEYAELITITPENITGGFAGSGNGFMYEELGRFYEINSEIKGEYGIQDTSESRETEIAGVLYSARGNLISDEPGIRNWKWTIAGCREDGSEYTVYSELTASETDKSDGLDVFIAGSDFFINSQDSDGLWNTQRINIINGEITSEEQVQRYITFDDQTVIYLGADNAVYKEQMSGSEAVKIQAPACDEMYLLNRKLWYIDEGQLCCTDIDSNEVTEWPQEEIRAAEQLCMNGDYIYVIGEGADDTRALWRTGVSEECCLLAEISGADIYDFRASKNYLFFEAGAEDDRISSVVYAYDLAEAVTYMIGARAADPVQENTTYADAEGLPETLAGEYIPCDWTGAHCPVMTITVDGDKCSIYVAWGNSAYSESIWEVSGTYDAKSASVKYSGIEYVNEYTENGSLVQKDVKDSEGVIYVRPEGRIFWQMSQESYINNIVMEKIVY